MQRATIIAGLAIASLLLLAVVRESETALLAAIALLGIVLAQWYDDDLAMLPRRQRLPDLHDIGLLLLATGVAFTTLGAIGGLLIVVRERSVDAVAWGTTLAFLLPLPVLAATALDRRPDGAKRPRLWPLGAALLASIAVAFPAVLSAALLDGVFDGKVSLRQMSFYLLVFGPTFGTLPALAAQLWGHAFRQGGYRPFDGRGMARSI